MPLPKSITIRPFVYKVDIVESNSALGEADPVNKILRIAKSCEQTEQCTLIHEIVEALNADYDIKLNHHQISLLEIGFYNLLKDNKFNY